MPKTDPQIEVTTSYWEPILEKITIPSPTASVTRDRIHDLLEQSLQSCTSTIISGRAGSGKTSTAIDFAEKCGRAVVWYKVDAPESNSQIFFHYLISSIRTQRKWFGEGLWLHVQEVTPVDISRLAELFVFELETNPGPPLLIVIEDLHLVCDADWLVPFFRRLLPLLPADVHMLITSRTIPPAPLWRMRSKQTLSVIEEETLAFTRDETQQLFEHYGLTKEQAHIAFEHSRGRAATLSGLAATLHFAENEMKPGEASLRVRFG
jgi:LuxR family transcriptional regulator, maltose regulon positive regulatory protein